MVDSALQLRSIFDHAIWLHGDFDSYQSCLLISVVSSLALCVFNLRLIKLIANAHSIIWRLADSSRQLRSIHHHVICFYYSIGLCQSSCLRHHSLLILKSRYGAHLTSISFTNVHLCIGQLHLTSTSDFESGIYHLLQRWLQSSILIHFTFGNLFPFAHHSSCDLVDISLSQLSSSSTCSLILSCISSLFVK